MDPATMLLIIIGVLAVWLIVDFLLAGGSMTGGMMGGMAGMMGSGIGPLVLLLLVILGLLAYWLY